MVGPDGTPSLVVRLSHVLSVNNNNIIKLMLTNLSICDNQEY